MSLTSLRYHIRLMSSGLFWGGWICVVLAMVAIANMGSLTKTWPNMPLLITVLSASMPVFTILLFAGVLAEETEKRLLPHLYTLPSSLLRLLIERVIIVAVFGLLAWGGLLLCSGFVMKSFTLRDMAHITSLVVPANLVFGLFVTLAVLLGNNTIAGLIPGFVYWFAELVFPSWGGPFRLIWRKLPDSPLLVMKHSFTMFGLIIIVFLLLCFVVTLGRAWILRK
ncbi:hypothetical protein [Paenibacillus ginsengarvi]|uniref:ABC transporter permease n=1 Tax=Paenibacillus ginsengarvi TaxID=400777 RepID=A0A3B0AUI2_9BACL|nr:hypothetical protein [Paenibacillus ginsengarvi]RKN64435.1 hypothetical protein D7M11_33795 [Paenibacillus ginsengarvi]